MLQEHSTQPAAAAAQARLRDWLDRFAAAVRDVDYDAAKNLFAENVVSFGTVARIVPGREELIAQQWKKVWGQTRNFHFLMGEAHIEIQNDLAWIATPWLSQGRDASGNWYDRPGRCTLVLHRVADQWLCIHSHYSREPNARPNGDATPA